MLPYQIKKDEAEIVLRSFEKYASVPIINMESAIAHPLQALADAITIKEFQPTQTQSRIELGPHPKALPHAVGNSFTQMMKHMDADFIIAHPEGYALNPKATQGVECTTDQRKSTKAQTLYIPKTGVPMLNTGKSSEQTMNG